MIQKLVTKQEPDKMLNTDLVKHLEHYGPINCLKIYKDYIFCGYGPSLKVYKVQGKSYSEVFNKEILFRNKIHNISFSPDGSKVVASGARSFVVLETQKVLKNKEISIIQKAINEWIIASEFKNDDRILLLTSHNVVYEMHVGDPETANYELISETDCNEKSILYSGSIRITETDILISAGTVMDGVLLWSLNSKKLIHRFSDHEGSIFSTKIDKTGSYMLSCSDDRSINLYSLYKNELIATGWGHTSRIWNLEFLRGQSSIRVFSMGEDCTARIWEFDPDNKDLKQIKYWDCHLGKHTWSGDIDDEYLNVAVTGGADGRIVLHDIRDLCTSDPKSFNIKDIFESISHTLTNGEIIKEFDELPKINSIIFLTSRGNIILYNHKFVKWFSIQLDDEKKTLFNNFGLLQTIKEISIALICSRNGDVLVLNFSKNSADLLPTQYWLTHDELGANKVTNFLISKANGCYYTLIDSPNHNIPFILDIFTVDEGDFKRISTKHLIQPEQASFTTTCMAIDSKSNTLLLGSRFVSICLYDLSCEMQEISIRSLFKKISLGDSITSLSIIESFKDSISVLTTVRDGLYMYLSFDLTDGKCSLRMLLRNKISRGLLMGGYLIDNQLILYGFKSTAFYIWNETKQCEIASIVCGGAHRQWKLFLKDTGNSADIFLYINKSDLFIKEFDFLYSSTCGGIINTGTHGREIRDCSVNEFSSSNDSFKLVSTVSEDTVLRLGKIFKNGEIQNFWCLNDHISGLQKVKFIAEDIICSSGANEELFLWRFGLTGQQVPIAYCELKAPSQCDNKDLRVMDFDAFTLNEVIYLAAVYSNSTIRIWSLKGNTMDLKLEADGVYKSCCILNVKFLNFSNHKLLLSIGSTNGFLAVWDMNRLRNSTKKFKFDIHDAILNKSLHQNSIKACEYVPVDEGFNIITGGDDNKLVLSYLSFKDAEFTIDILDQVVKAASSTITSITMLDKENFAVSSVDQIIKIWNIKSNQLESIFADYTTVADTGCITSTVIDGSRLLLIGGAGLSIWKIN